MNTQNSLILLHGALGCRDTLSDVAERLSDRFQVHLPDLPAHGTLAAQQDPLSVDGLVDFLHAYINTHKLEKPAIFGYSLGGYIAIAHALRHQGMLRGILTLATKYYWNPEIAVRETRMLDPEVIEAKVPAFANLLKQRHGDAHWKALLANTAALMTSLGEAPVITAQSVARCPIPVTIALGSADKMVTEEESQAIVDALPHSRFRLLPDVPHPIEKVPPEIVSDLIVDTLGHDSIEL